MRHKTNFEATQDLRHISVRQIGVRQNSVRRSDGLCHQGDGVGWGDLRTSMDQYSTAALRDR